VTTGAPLHGSPEAVTVAQRDVVSHPDFVAVVEDRRPWQRQEQRVGELEPAAVVVEQRVVDIEQKRESHRAEYARRARCGRCPLQAEVRY